MNCKWLLPVCAFFLSTTVAFSQETRPEKQDFVYKTVDGHDILATIYLPESAEKVPVVVYFHGGGFIFGNREQGLENVLREKLLASDIAVVSADYRLAPETYLDDILRDTRDAVAWIKANGSSRFNIDTSRIAVAGGSAGGYLAIASGFDARSAPDAIVAISAPTGFSTEGLRPAGDPALLESVKQGPVVSYGDYGSRMELWRGLLKNDLGMYGVFGFDPVAAPRKLERYTLTHNIQPGYPPVLIVHAKNDRLVRADDARAFYTFLQEKGIASELYWVENGHDSELIRQHPEAVDEIVAFLSRQFNR